MGIKAGDDGGSKHCGCIDDFATVGGFDFGVVRKKHPIDRKLTNEFPDLHSCFGFEWLGYRE